MGIAGTSRVFGSASWIGEEVGIDDLVEAFMGGGTVYSDKQLVVSRTVDPVGLSFSGEIDVTNRDAVAKCLAMTPAGEDETHLDVSRLIFCDISGIRAFVDAAEARRNGRLLLHGLPELLQTVMSVTGWADLPTLVFCYCKAGSV
jgi:anti-anti-sigma factor